jgi:hypothetical protein
MRKIIVEIQAPELTYNCFRIKELLSYWCHGDQKIQVEVLSDTSDPQVHRTTETELDNFINGREDLRF